MRRALWEQRHHDGSEERRGEHPESREAPLSGQTRPYITDDGAHAIARVDIAIDYRGRRAMEAAAPYLDVSRHPCCGQEVNVAAERGDVAIHHARDRDTAAERRDVAPHVTQDPHAPAIRVGIATDPLVSLDAERPGIDDERARLAGRDALVRWSPTVRVPAQSTPPGHRAGPPK